MELHLFKRIGTVEALNLLRNLSMTLKAGVPLVRALTILEEEATKSKKILSHLRSSCESGHALAQAMESASRKFPPIAVHLVRAGELSGTLQESLREVVKHLEAARNLRRKIRSAMMYPTFVLVAVLGLGLSVGTLVLPELIPLFESLDVELPLMTRVLLWLAAFFESSGILFSGAVTLIVVMLFFILRLSIMKPLLHRVLLMTPLLRTVLKKATIAHITGTLATLLRSGIPIGEAITATAEATENRVYRKALETSLPVLQAGNPFSLGLRESRKLFPAVVLALVEVGEETGTLQQSLDYIAEYYEMEVEYALKDLTTVLEPILLIGIGVIVGGTVLAIITPIYDVTGSIK